GDCMEVRFVRLTWNCTDLAALSVDKANGRASLCRVGRARRARRLDTRWPLAAFFFRRGDLFPVAGCESEYNENGEQASQHCTWPRGTVAARYASAGWANTLMIKSYQIDRYRSSRRIIACCYMKLPADNFVMLAKRLASRWPG